MAQFLGLTMEAPDIVDWVPDREYDTAGGDSRIVATDSHRFDLSFTLSDIDGQHDLRGLLLSHWRQNRGASFAVEMPQELRRGLAGADSYGSYVPTARTLTVAVDAGAAIPGCLSAPMEPALSLRVGTSRSAGTPRCTR